MDRPANWSAYRMAALSAVGLVVGAIAALLAIAFVDLIGLMNAVLLIAPHARVQMDDSSGVLTAATVLVPALGGVVVGLIVQSLVDERRALGPPDTILTVQTGGLPPRIRSGIASTAAALVSLGCGASVGQYGPLVYLGTIIGAVASRLRVGLADLQSVAIACGVAAAISTAFNAPIAGIVFAHEVILRHFSLRAFAPVTVASGTGYVIANVIFDREPLFLVRFGGVEQAHEFVLFALVGVFGAMVAVAYMRFLAVGAWLADRLPGPAALRPGFAGLALGLVALQLPEVLGVGTETLRFTTIDGAFEIGELAALLIAKILLTALCIGFGFVGGVFSPALLIGALFGALGGAAVGIVFPGGYSGVAVYAVCGMTAVFSPVIGGPLTAIMIVFELTRSYDLTVAAMVAVVFSNLLANRLFGRSLFDVQLAGRGFDLSMGRDRAILQNRRVTEVSSVSGPVADPQEPLREALVRIASAGRSEAPVVDAAGIYRGLIRAGSLATSCPDALVADVVTDEGLVFDQTTTVWEALERMRHFVGDAAAVVESDSKRFLGTVTEAAVIGAYLDTAQSLKREEHAVL